VREELLNEEDLVRRAQGGDRGAFELLAKLHARTLYRMAYRMVNSAEVAEDVTQEALLKAYQNIGSFRGDSKFSSWLIQIVMNTGRNVLRSQNRRNETDIEDEVIASEHKDYQKIEGLQALTKLKEAVDQLPPRQKMALELRLFEELSFKEIAAIMDCPFDTAKANFRHALMKLREKLAEDGIEIPGVESV
jgi:RNA polymerase sigma-70 factor (ECF subfamily)